MKDAFTKHIVTVVALVLGLLALDRLPPHLGHGKNAGRLKLVIASLENTELNTDDQVTRANGYYEGLQHTVRIAPGAENEDYRLRDDFLRYEFRPYVKRPYAAGVRVTNSLGMPNPEYGREKPLRTRRIALIGDSVSVGPYGQDFEALLEKRLNETHLTPETRKFEILNFATPGYILAQKMDVALEKAPAFHPDVYMIQLSTLEIGGTANHISRLVVSGLDLKYGFLKRTAAQAGIQRNDTRSIVRYKLAPFFRPVTRWALEQIRDHTASEGARMIVVLINPVMDPDVTATHFAELHQVTDTLGVPVLDLRDTFRGTDQPSLQVVPNVDPHPNAEGHRMLFEDLYARLRANQQAWAALVGAQDGSRATH